MKQLKSGDVVVGNFYGSKAFSEEAVMVSFCQTDLLGLELLLLRKVENVPCDRLTNLSFVKDIAKFLKMRIKPCLHTGWICSVNDGQLYLIDESFFKQSDSFFIIPTRR